MERFTQRVKVFSWIFAHSSFLLQSAFSSSIFVSILNKSLYLDSLTLVIRWTALSSLKTAGLHINKTYLNFSASPFCPVFHFHKVLVAKEVSNYMIRIQNVKDEMHVCTNCTLQQYTYLNTKPHQRFLNIILYNIVLISEISKLAMSYDFNQYQEIVVGKVVKKGIRKTARPQMVLYYQCCCWAASLY